MSRPRALIIGAGALGLGFLAERLAPDYDLCLADVPDKAEFLRLIEAHQGFALNVCRLDGMSVQPVRGAFQIVLSRSGVDCAALTEALQEADLVLTAVGNSALDRLMASIARPMNVRLWRGWLLFCENGQHIAARYGPRFGPQTVVVDTVMSRMCRFGEPEEREYAPLWPGHDTALIVEDYGSLPLDAELCAGGPFSPAFSLVSHSEFACWEDVKLFLHNGMHAFVGYRTFLAGVRTFAETPAWIRLEARQVMLQEVVPAIGRTHPGANPGEIERYGLGLLDRFFNPFFKDSVERSIRGVEDKLVPGERLLGGCEYIRRGGIEPRGYAGTMEAARGILARQVGQRSA